MPDTSASPAALAPARPARVAWAVLLLAVLAVFGMARAQAQPAPQQLRFQGKAERTQVQVGEPFTYSLVLEYSGRQATQRPTAPDFGGLMIRSGPSVGNQIYSDSRGVRFVNSYTWELVAAREGTFTIGPSQLTLDQIYQTEPVVITATAQAMVDLPADLQGSNSVVAMARTGNAAIDQQLRGRLFLRATFSNPRPYVGEPVVITYALYNDGIDLLRAGQQEPPDTPGAVTEKLFNANQIQWKTVQVGGRSYQMAEMYRMAVMPNQPGELTVQGYSMNGLLRSPNRGGNDPYDPFGLLNDPFFGNGLQLELPSPPVVLSVQPLPTAGAPAGWSGTIGEYRLGATFDRTQVTEDDLLTLRVTLEGRGAVQQAGEPDLAAATDFEVVGKSQETKKQPSDEMIGGTKTFEYVLRPLRAGRLVLPPLRYAAFNPWSGRFDTLESPQLEVMVGPGQHGTTSAAPATAPGNVAGASPRSLGLAGQLKSISQVELTRPGVMLESPGFWGSQLAMAGLLVAAWRRDRRRAAFDPAQARRGRAWRRFAKRLARVRELARGKAGAAESAAELERAVLGLVADKFNLSAEGLTARELEQRLLAASVSPERVTRLLALLEACAAVRYAPAATSTAAVEEWATESAAILREGLK